nr:MAG TPA: hypothetical protein [Crassvirales sp.]
MNYNKTNSFKYYLFFITYYFEEMYKLSVLVIILDIKQINFSKICSTSLCFIKFQAAKFSL